MIKKGAPRWFSLWHHRGAAVRRGWCFLQKLWIRINNDRVLMVAGSLAYITLLSLVPLVMVMASLFTAFPMFDVFFEQLKQLAFNNFVPAVGNEVQDYLAQFVANTKKMTTVGIIGLILSVLLLVAAVDSALNQIWHSGQSRPLLYAFAIYWLALTFGPLLIGASMALSASLSMHWLLINELYSRVLWLLTLFPLLLSWGSFTLLYSVISIEKLRLTDVVWGGLVAGGLFEVGKKLFVLYVVDFPTYQSIYGVVAVLPILFIWIYWSWCIVLLGAEVIAMLAETRQKTASSSTQ